MSWTNQTFSDLKDITAVESSSLEIRSVDTRVSNIYLKNCIGFGSLMERLRVITNFL